MYGRHDAVQTASPYTNPPANAPRKGLEISGIKDMQIALQIL
jgi:hypothetical protein